MSAKRLKTLAVKIGKVMLGDDHPISPQTMTTTDTMDTQATVQQSIACIDAGAQLVRITAPSKKEAQNLKLIKDNLTEQGYDTPLVADIHYTPNAAEIAAEYVEKVRINPGNYVDKKKFEHKEYTDESYAEEIEKIREKLVQLIAVCQQNDTAMRIGTNHGSLSDRIMSRYGDTPEGMVESAMEFLRIARSQNYHRIVLSMKSSNPIVMVQAYRTLVAKMLEEFGEVYPLHLGVTEAGDGEDGRVKSALGIGTLLEDGLGDTVRVSLTEDPQYEIPVCQELISKFDNAVDAAPDYTADEYLHVPVYTSQAIQGIGGDHHSIVVARTEAIGSLDELQNYGYAYDEDLDKWHTREQAADLLIVDMPLRIKSKPESLLIALPLEADTQADFIRVNLRNTRGLTGARYLLETSLTEMLRALKDQALLDWILSEEVILLLDRSGSGLSEVRDLRQFFIRYKISAPVLWRSIASSTGDRAIIDHTVAVGSPFIEKIGDGVEVSTDSGESLIPLAYSILQATRTRISKTEYISCPSCGRTLFDLQETTARIRQATQHLKGVKIAIMGCIVNGPGEMADADFGYVGAGPDKISLYKGQEVVRRNIPTTEAVDALIDLLKEYDAWQEPLTV